ncbi:MAG: diaminopimelate epimerase [Bacteroides sp.]|jgi:diaminopimelate epimerase|nr:diaminopimelate epimerase [Bacteroides sp.]
MALTFHKFHGDGNDFIIIDDRSDHFHKQIKDPEKHISRLCKRHYGTGADGLMLLIACKEADFAMVYYNSDGREGSLCGNGGRCIVAFAAELGLIGEKTVFMAADGLHEAVINHQGVGNWDISLQMNNVHQIEGQEREFVLNTGSPHLVIFSENILDKDVFSEGRDLRFSAAFASEGINVNFAEVLDKTTIRMRTYERGVENETLACGTGATAIALAAWQAGFRNPENQYTLKAPGGDLRVSFTPPREADHVFTNIWLSGPVEKVFTGTFEP